MGGETRFYKVSGDDAIIIHYLLKYKIKDKKIIIFPKEALEKVINIIKLNSISYEIVNEIKHDFYPNNYELIKSKSYQALDKEYRVDEIVNKLNKLDSCKLNKFLEYLESYDYE